MERNEKGFTLIELLLYVGICALALSALFGLLSFVIGARVRMESMAEVDEQGVQIMQSVLQEMRNAEAVTSPTLGNSASSVTLDVVDASRDPVTFSLSGDALVATENGVSTTLTNSLVTISGFTVQNLGQTGTAGVLQVTFTVTRVNNSGRREYDYERTFTGSAALRMP